VVIKVRKSGGASDAGSYTYAGEYPTEDEYFFVYGIFKREKCPYQGLRG
jgi:hypothetical protein